MCQFCGEVPETIEHLFYDCRITKIFWTRFQSWFECQTDTEIFLDMETVFFCNHDDSFLNVLLLIAKQYIFTTRCLDKTLNIYLYKDKVMDIVRMERHFALTTKRYKPFVKEWKRLFE